MPGHETNTNRHISKAVPPGGERSTHWEKRRRDQMEALLCFTKEDFPAPGKLHVDSFTCISRQGSCAFAPGQERVRGRQQSVNNAALPGAELQAAS